MSGKGLDRIIITVVGDPQVGKTSIISSLVADSFSERIPTVLQPVIVPPEVTREKIPLAIIDTSSCTHDLQETVHHIRHADAVVLVVSKDRPSSLSRVSSYWLPLLNKLNSKAPVVVAINKSPVQDSHLPSEFQFLVDDMQLEACIECSAKNLNFISDVFFTAQRAVLAPVAPLYDNKLGILSPLLVKALNRVFRYFDGGNKGILNDPELNSFQHHCFGRRMTAHALANIKCLLQQEETKKSLPPLIDRDGVTLDGFLRIHEHFILKHRADSVWRVLQTFKYGRDLHLIPDLFTSSIDPSANKTVELTGEGLDILTQIYNSHAKKCPEGITCEEFKHAFSSCPTSSFDEVLFNAITKRVESKQATMHTRSPEEQDSEEGVSMPSIRERRHRVIRKVLTLQGWLSYFTMYAFFKPQQCALLMAYIGYFPDQQQYPRTHSYTFIRKLFDRLYTCSHSLNMRAHATTDFFDVADTLTLL